MGTVREGGGGRTEATWLGGYRTLHDTFGLSSTNFKGSIDCSETKRSRAKIIIKGYV